MRKNGYTWVEFIVTLLIMGFVFGGAFVLFSKTQSERKENEGRQVEAAINAPKTNIWIEENGSSYTVYKDEVSGARIFSRYQGGVVVLPPKQEGNSLPEK